MRNIPIDTIKSFVRDRTLVALSGLLVLTGVAYIAYVIIALEPSDLQVAIRYTAFGDTHFYRNKWYYLLSFVLFAAILVGIHIALAIKLYGRQKRQLAVAFLAFTLALLIFAWILTQSVLGVAFL